MKLLLGDCLEKLKELEDNSVDAVVTDPPYEIGFMGKGWDDSGIANNPELWKEVLRVLKPGGHLLSFSHSRTYHRQAVAVEDAGFEIRDQIMWIYGSGFPKSHDVGKNIEKIKVGGKSNLTQIGTKPGLVATNHNDKAKTSNPSGFSYRTNQKGYSEVATDRTQVNGEIPVYEITNEWEGWGTALKPAHEPIVMARKPFNGTVAGNVLEWGTGGINVDGCRIGTEKVSTHHAPKGTFAGGDYDRGSDTNYYENEGRFPANIIFDEEAGKILDEQSGISKSSPNKWEGNNNAVIYGKYEKGMRQSTFSDKGGASRFFYCPKANKSDRDEGMDLSKDKQRPGQTDKGLYSSSPVCKDCGKTVNGTNDHSKCKEGLEYRPSTTTRKNIHPTVKPTELMGYLIRLVTPKGGIVLDPFMGSGSTGKAAVREGMEFIGIEREAEYMEIARQRIEYELDKKELEESKRKFW